MKAIFTDFAQHKFNLRGLCPHADCKRPSVFVPVAGPVPIGYEMWLEALQCQGCFKYILGQVKQGIENNMAVAVYLLHYPMGSPDDNVAEQIPTHIKADFQEALRCMFVDAYNATAEMCRRALEASCLEQGAPKKKKLDDMIDWLEQQRKITPHLKDIAHKIRLGGNRAAHPPEDGPKPEGAVEEEEGPVENIGKEHAEAIIMFTREFFHHLYVVPAQLDKYDFSKPKGDPAVKA